MGTLSFHAHRSHLDSILQAALKAGDPRAAVMRNLRLKGEDLLLGGRRVHLDPHGRLFLIGLGKAAPAMCEAAAYQLGDRLSQGVAAVPRTFTGPAPPRMIYHPAGHPLPDGGSLAAGKAAFALLRTTRERDLVMVLISGGGSAMLELPLPGISLGDLRELNHLLIRSGAPIEEINVVRRSLSQIKGGGLARMASPAPVVSLILSDVVGNRLSSIASGPTTLRRPSPQAALSVLQRHNLWNRVPGSVREALRQAPSPLPRARRPMNLLIAANREVVLAAAREAEALGFPSRVLSFRLHGEAREAARRFARRLIRARPPVCLLMGGETTVTVVGSGRGGRNQEFALAAAQVISQTPRLALMALATDGTDGPTPAAGAIVTGDTDRKARSLGLSLQAALGQNDAYPLLKRTGCLIYTGPTGTNLNDLVVGVAYAR